MKKFCFIGHVDSGKSTTAGHLVYKTGGLAEHDFDNLKRTSKTFNLWSSVLDIWEEEREKSKTHEFNEIIIKFKEKEYKLIDTPGHKNFIRSMIEGISQVDDTDIIACLMISSAKGEFDSGWLGGQTKEDLIIAKSVGIRGLIILINKMDKVGWQEEIYQNIIKEMTPFIKKLNFEVVHFMPISGWEGLGLTTTQGLPNWFKGVSLMDLIENIKLKEIKIPPIEEEKWTIINCKLELFEMNTIMAPGYLCVMHYGGDEIEVLIKKFKTKKFLKSWEVDDAIISSQIPIFRKRTRRFVLRKDGFTVGWGRILKVK